LHGLRRRHQIKGTTMNERIVKLAVEAGADWDRGDWNMLIVRECIDAAVKAEREACAKLVDAIEARCIAKDVDDPPLEHVAAAIRARGQA
jgi:hypothetical protein